MKVIGFIPVRGGSKSIPKKNIKLFCGKPLVYWTMNALSQATTVDDIIIATESDEIEQVVNELAINKIKVYRRSRENAQDNSSTESVLLEYLKKNIQNESDIIVLVQATSPFLQSIDIEKAIRIYNNGGIDSILSCVRQKRFYWNDNGIPINYDYKNRPRRQEFNGILMENGAFYINSIKNIIENKNRLSGKIYPFIMPEYSSIELDEEDDWLIAETMMKKYLLNKKIKNKIKLFLSDVDGVLTDAGMYYSEKGDELKKFNTRDGKGFELLRNAGIKTGIITSENTKIVTDRATKLKVDYLFQGIKDKILEVKKICEIENLSLNEVAYIGDDINDFEVLKRVGFPACPRNAVEKLKTINNIKVLKNIGGHGVVREFIDYLLEYDY